MIACFFDPGLLTGACVYDFDQDELVLLDEFDYIRTGHVLDQDNDDWLLEDHVTQHYGVFGHPDFLVGWENYRIMKGPQSQAPYSLEVIGELKYLSDKHGYTVLKPPEPKARTVITADMIKRCGWHPQTAGKKDAFSAGQHFLAWCLRSNCLPNKYKDAVLHGL